MKNPGIDKNSLSLRQIKILFPYMKVNHTSFDIYKFKFSMPMPVNTVKINFSICDMTASTQPVL